MLRNITVALITMLGLVWGQYIQSPSASVPGVKLLDSNNRFQWHTSYSLQVMALQGRMLSMGTITGNWSFQYSPRLVFRGQLGLTQTGFNRNLPGANFNGPQLWWRGQIVYRPRPGMSLLLDFGQYPVVYPWWSGNFETDARPVYDPSVK